MRSVRRTVAIGMVIAAVSSTACGIGDRKKQAARITNSVAQLVLKRTAVATVSQSFALHKAPRGLQQALGAATGRPTATTIAGAPSAAEPTNTGGAALALAQAAGAGAAGGGRGATGAATPTKKGVLAESSGEIELDFTKHRAVVSAPLAAATPPAPILIFDDTRYYQRRIATGGRAPGGRAWSKLDFGKLDAKTILRDAAQSQGTSFRAVGLNPALIVELVRGALSGSIKSVGLEDVAGTPTTHYKFNFDRTKAIKGQKDKRIEAVNSVFAANLVPGDVMPGEVWLDSAGVPRRVLVNIDVKPGRRNLVYRLTLTMDLHDFGAPVTESLPAASEVAEVEGVGSFAQTATPNG